MKAYVDENCIGCGLCTSLCPEVFQMTDEQVAVASQRVSAGMEDTVAEARENCPVDAIHTEE